MLIFIAFLFVFHQFGYIGHYGFDDMQYAELAHNFLQGRIDFQDHFTFRFTIIVLTSFSYLLFGVNDFASSLPTILVSASILFMVYRISKKQGSAYVFISLSLTVFCTWFISYSDKLMPDMYLAACVMLSFYLFHQYRYGETKRNSVIQGVLFSISLFLGFCSKGTIVLILPWLAYILIVDIKRNRDWSFWISVLISGIGLLALYFASIYAFTGEASQRFDAIASNAYLNRCSYDQQSIKILIKRLVIELPSLFMREGMITSFLFIIPYYIGKVFLKEKDSNNELNYAVNSSVILLLASNFMTISPTSYIPMCLDARHFLFFIPIAAVSASMVIPYIFNKMSSFISFIVLNLTIMFFMFQEGNSIYWGIYGLVLILGIIFKFINIRNLTWIFALAISAISFHSINGLFSYANAVNYDNQREQVYKEVLSIKEPSYIITNEVQKRLGKYYQKFDSNHPITFLSYNRFSQDTLKDWPIYILENKHTRNLMFYDENDLPLYVRYKSNNDFEIFSDPTTGITFTHIDQILNPEENAIRLSISENDFEKNYPNWNQNNEHLNTGIKHRGEKSILCPMYSSTYILEIDSSTVNSLNEALYISAKVMVWTADKTNATLVISLENNDGSYSYLSTPLNKYISTYSNWWPIELKSFTRKNDLKKNTKLKVYIHNQDQNTIYLDDFKVELKSL